MIINMNINCKLEMDNLKTEAHKNEEMNVENLKKIDSLMKENEELMKENERRKEEEKLEEERWQRANLDFDRMKVCMKKLTKKMSK